MKSVLISIQPKWCELIANGKKTIEVRKTRPKIETPFKCYIYCTSVKSIPLNEYVKIHQTTGGKIDDWHGKVIGEFVCDEITTYLYESYNDGEHFMRYGELEKTCLDGIELYEYLGTKDGYGWHISNLVIYGEPNELYEFYSACKNEAENDCSKCIDGGKQNCFALTRPPQSWCYVMEVNENDRA